MFTTATPGAHDASIVRSAESPSNDAPYPTLVGTATMGVEMRPATTEGSAPSMPATTMAQSVAWSAARCSRIRWTPATPTSVIRSTRTPAASSEIAASSATGRSDVPAATTATVASIVSSAGFTTTSRARS